MKKSINKYLRLKYPTHTTRILNLKHLSIALAKPNLSRKYIFSANLNICFDFIMVIQQKIICNEKIIIKFARRSSGFYPEDIYTGSENALKYVITPIIFNNASHFI